MLQPTLLNQISNIYYIEDDSYPITYRYVSMREATNLFDKHQLYFTNTSSWAKNATPDSGDPLETAFENWWLDPDNLSLYINTLCKYKNQEFNRFGLTASLNILSSTISQHICKYMTLQNDSYSYCLAGTWNNPLMVKEYHHKWKRDVILQFNKAFPYNLSLLNNPQLALNSDALCADFFKMHYVNSIEDWIMELALSHVGARLVEKILKEGSVRRHSSFQYETEKRLKLQILSPCILYEKCTMAEVYNNLFTADSIDEIICRCHKMIEDVRKDFVDKQQLLGELKLYDSSSNTEYLIINNIPNNIIDCVYVFDTITSEDMNKINFWSQQYNFKIVTIHG